MSDVRPLVAIADVLRVRPFDHVIVVTRPSGESRWLKQDLPARVRSAFRLPVTHVVVERKAIAV